MSTNVLRGTVAVFTMALALGSTAPASAETPWLLWSRQVVIGSMDGQGFQSIVPGGDRWDAVDTYDTRAACRSALGKAVTEEVASRNPKPTVTIVGPVTKVAWQSAPPAMPGGGWKHIWIDTSRACWPAGYHP